MGNGGPQEKGEIEEKGGLTRSGESGPPMSLDGGPREKGEREEKGGVTAHELGAGLGGYALALSWQGRVTYTYNIHGLSEGHNSNIIQAGVRALKCTGGQGSTPAA